MNGQAFVIIYSSSVLENVQMRSEKADSNKFTVSEQKIVTLLEDCVTYALICEVPENLVTEFSQ